MYKALNSWAIGIKLGSLTDTINAARRYGFAGVEFNAGEVADLIDKSGAEKVKTLFSDS